MKVLTAEAMREVDRRAIEEIGVPSLVLMENAALGTADALGELCPDAERVAIFCGPGNNGGDGLAVARQLFSRGYGVEVLLALGGRSLEGDAAVQRGICERLGIPLLEITEEPELAPALAAAAAADLVVDALFGTGLARPLAGFFAELVEGINGLARPVLAVDLPSGLAGSSHRILGPHVVADWTVTFAAPKVAHVLAPAAEAVGELVVADLGVPPSLVEEAEGDLQLLEEDEVRLLLPPRPAAAHKGDFGHALILAGGPGRSGAAILAARAAVRSGAGLVTAAVPAPIANPVDLGSVESMTRALPADASGELAGEAAGAVVEALAGKDALAVGPGLGRSPGAEAAIREVVLGAGVPLVLDADGLNAFAGRLAELTGRPAPTVLTPHPGEMGRLLGIATSDVEDDRLAAVRRAAALSGAVVVLKGHRTLVAEPAGRVWINPTGNSGMASGGTGDVLTGMIAALLARGLPAASAARVAAFAHGLAGDRAAERRGEVGLAAGDLVDELPTVWVRLSGP
ncbi:MAG TPA: NAD(P)H-hydrate dehydratase [Thermoanaerobaculia bacterium]|nr:NAD(P)H-hydrate dehydratase [Thermoanaerobaculia bacterium]